MTPPETLDGAEVLFWAWSGDEPFFVMPDTEGWSGERIHGLAVCRYPNGAVYRFSCDAAWEVVNDSPWATPEDAMTRPSAQYDIAAVPWRPFPPSVHP